MPAFYSLYKFCRVERNALCTGFCIDNPSTPRRTRQSWLPFQTHPIATRNQYLWQVCVQSCEAQLWSISTVVPYPTRSPAETTRPAQQLLTFCAYCSGKINSAMTFGFASKWVFAGPKIRCYINFSHRCTHGAALCLILSNRSTVPNRRPISDILDPYLYRIQWDWMPHRPMSGKLVSIVYQFVLR